MFALYLLEFVRFKKIWSNQMYFFSIGLISFEQLANISALFVWYNTFDLNWGLCIEIALVFDRVIFIVFRAFQQFSVNYYKQNNS